MMPSKPKEDLGNERVFKKLGKSLVAGVDVRAGERLTLDSLSGRIFRTQYIPVRESNQVVGRVTKRDLRQGEPISYADLEG
jgi:N-acetylneuraminate synthase/sialic acid synthase